MNDEQTGPDPVVDYFFVGVGKCGTTWLYEFVRRHGLATVPEIKEPYLLDQPPADQARLLRRLWRDRDRMCDFSNTYYWDPDNPVKIREHNPTARVIVTVRRPTDRARSHHRFLVRNGMTPHADFADYLRAGDDHDVVERCDYDRVLRRYRSIFPTTQILVLPLEQLSSDPQRYIDRLCSFLGSDRVVVSDQDRTPVLPRRTNRHRGLSQLAKASAVTLRRLGALRLLGRLKRSALLDRLLFRPTGQAPAAPVDWPRLAELDRAYERLLQDESVIGAPGHS